MEKNKLLEARKSKGFTQSLIAEKLCMDVSSYNRRENGQVRIHITEWEKLAKILDTPLHEIYEPEESQLFICNDNTSVNYQGTNNIYIPESLLETQEKYIKILEEKIEGLKVLLQKK
ncbi:MAG: helix-turn-helix domain-containing protein [Bacteroidetes bacterium]|nr:helix-turn-helix domain-containing protein [Bacteroidota bacterium]MCL2303552.1 helix-turn-helix domain-containing protein [Lentimicrobiaceae bacterium]